MSKFVISLRLDKLIVLLNFLFLFHVFFLLLYEGSHTEACVFEEVLTNDIGAEPRLLHHVLWCLKYYTAVSFIVLLLCRRRGACLRLHI